MSVRKNKSEIHRLIKAFEREADLFHELTFRKFIIDIDSTPPDDKFLSPNHTVMLWQYYGELDGRSGVEKLSNNLEKSNLQWCMRGAKLSCFAVLEGESCKLFTRMANRASSLFNKKEIETISSRVVGEIQKNRLDGNGKPTAVTNRNPVVVWLNYLLYHLSMVSPEREYSKYIQPDPFSLSLLALEGLLENETIHKVDKSLKKVESIQFKVALSFPGEKRPYVSIERIGHP